MKVTKEQLEAIITPYIGVYNQGYNSDINECLTELIDILEPSTKPLSELKNSIDDCKKVFKFFYPENEYLFTRALVLESRKSVQLCGKPFVSEGRSPWTARVEVYLDGSVEQHKASRINPFALVELFKSLGYDVTPETK